LQFSDIRYSIANIAILLSIKPHVNKPKFLDQGTNELGELGGQAMGFLIPGDRSTRKRFKNEELRSLSP
jgi:hypothetical protein